MFYKSLKSGFKFQFVYSIYSIKKFTLISLVFLILIISIKSLSPVVIWFQKNVISTIEQSIGYSKAEVLVMNALIMYFIISFVVMLLSEFSSVIENIVKYKVTLSLTKKLYCSLQNRPLEFFDHAGNMVKCERASEAVNYVVAGLVMLASSMGCFITIATSTTMISNYYPWILVVYYISGLLTAYSLYISEKVNRYLRREQKIEKRKLRYFQNIISNRNNISEIRIHGYYKSFMERWDNIYDKTNTEYLSTDLKVKSKQFIINIINQGIKVIELIMLIRLVLFNRLDIGTYSLIIGMGEIIRQSLNKILQLIAFTSALGVDIQDIDDILYQSRDNTLKNNTDFNFQKPLISFRKVGFSYPNKREVLRNIDFDIKKGEIVALVGKNGSGKTTLAKLVLGLYNPTEGVVEYYGKNLKEIQQKKREEIMNVVFQDFGKYEFLFRENVGFGFLPDLYFDEALKEAVDKGGARQVLDRAGDDFDVCLGRTYDENGIDISGGEWQKVAISRGFMGEPDMIVFDEPTASLDPLAELKQFERLKEFLNGRSAVIISHRVGIARMANKIFYVENGEIAESGSHNELVNLKGKYYCLFNEQAKWYKWSDIL